MTHRFPLKEIARQAGLGTATVDRVLHNRAHVSPQTRARVEAAITELSSQEAQLAARGRRMFFDFLIEAPTRFSREVQHAALSVAGSIGVAVCRPRFLMQEIMHEEEVVRTLQRIAKRGSHGVCLKARDLPRIRRAVEQLGSTNIPVVTLVTDVSTEPRRPYVGLDNDRAGRTAAYLVTTSLGQMRGTILTTRSDESFLGEEEREIAFCKAVNDRAPDLRIVRVAGGSGKQAGTAQLIEDAIGELRDLRAVYSMGGGNRAILEVLDRHGLEPTIFVAHDLDRDNRALIDARRLNFVLHHDLAVDMRNVFLSFLHHHRLMAEHPEMTANIQIVTPENMPMTSSNWR